MSRKFYMVLNRFIGTEALVKKRREERSERYDYKFSRNSTVAPMPSGSKAEGLDMTGSDEDIMIYFKDYLKVYFNSIPNIVPPACLRLFYAEPVAENPGFVIINCFNSSDKTYMGILKSSDFAENVMANFKSTHYGQSMILQRHGPCWSSYGYGDDMDCAVCLSSDQWPDAAKEWQQRKRQNGWPKRKIITSIIRQGCHVVPIGYDGNQAMDWRMSFSVAETTLVHSFNHVQLLTYGFLKLFLKEVINGYPIVDNMLCSYFMKTILFWTIEETPHDTWTANNILSCVWMCFKRLVKCIENKQCPNYFIRNNNMFKKKVTTEAKEQLLTVMNSVMDDGINSVFRSVTIRRLWSENLSVTPAFEERKLDALSMDQICRAIYELFYASIHVCVSDIYRLKIYNINYKCSLRECLSQFKYTDFRPVIRNIALQNICHCMMFSIRQENKYYYALDKLLTKFLIAGSKTDISAGKLVLATWLYGRKQYHKCLQVTDYAMNRIKDALYYNKSCSIALREAKEIERESCGLNLSCSDKARLFLLSDVMIPMGSVIALPEIKEIFNGIELITQGNCRRLLFPPNLYGHFLRACCHSKIGKTAQTLQALRDMKQEDPLLPNDPIYKKSHHMYYSILLIIFTGLIPESKYVNCSEFQEDINLFFKNRFEYIGYGKKFGWNMDYTKHFM